MGTRAIVHIKNAGLKSETLVTLYRQFDGYKSGLGKDLKNIIKGKKISNGITKDCFNSMGCMAAFIIKELKDCVGNVYIYPLNKSGVGEEFTYTIYRTGKEYLDLGDFAEIKIKYEE